MWLYFLIVRVPLAYNVILGLFGLNILRITVSTYYLLVYFLIRNGTGEMQGDQQLARQCYLTMIKRKRPMKALPIEGLDLREEESWGEPIEWFISLLKRRIQLRPSKLDPYWVIIFRKSSWPSYMKILTFLPNQPLTCQVFVAWSALTCRYSF